MPWLIISLLLFTPYALLILYYWQSWKAIPIYTAQQQPQTFISIVIPARNEEKNISNLLHCLVKQNYPAGLFEIIVVDDHSEDNTAAIVKKFANVKLIQLKEGKINSYKKKAVETGIASASGQLVVTTDADCTMAPGWLRTIASFSEESGAVFIAAPVVFDCNSSVLQVFQALDFMVLQGITGAGVYRKKLSMSNGANLAYEKKVFNEVGGFSGIDHIASGDDMLLMYKIQQQHPDKVLYLKSKEALVSTQPAATWKEFFNQRIRWASKAKTYKDKRVFAVLLLVYLFNLVFPVLLLTGNWLYAVVFLTGKTAVELLFVAELASFFGKQSLVKYFFFFQPLHIIYTIIAGLFGQFGKYEWKGRRVK
jgi:poly-beta-1,6-N-acetyl-D-glucosamine synthase